MSSHPSVSSHDDAHKEEEVVAPLRRRSDRIETRSKVSQHLSDGWKERTSSSSSSGHTSFSAYSSSSSSSASSFGEHGTSSSTSTAGGAYGSTAAADGGDAGGGELVEAVLERHLPGRPWSEAELSIFLNGLRQHGPAWKKIASELKGRTPEMVEELYTLNQRFLSGPDQATVHSQSLSEVVGDHYAFAKRLAEDLKQTISNRSDQLSSGVATWPNAVTEDSSFNFSSSSSSRRRSCPPRSASLSIPASPVNKNKQISSTSMKKAASATKAKSTQESLHASSVVSPQQQKRSRKRRLFPESPTHTTTSKRQSKRATTPTEKDKISSSTSSRKSSRHDSPSKRKSKSPSSEGLPLKLRAKVDSGKMDSPSTPARMNLRSATRARMLQETTPDLNALGQVERMLTRFLWEKSERWCKYEWFYSDLDYPFFHNNEFQTCLDQIGLGAVTKLTRVEWGHVRTVLGKPRRFSDSFLKCERKKLETYRNNLRAARSGHSPLSQALSHLPVLSNMLGAHVLAIHPHSNLPERAEVKRVEGHNYLVRFHQHHQSDDHDDEQNEFWVMDTETMRYYPGQEQQQEIAVPPTMYAVGSSYGSISPASPSARPSLSPFLLHNLSSPPPLIGKKEENEEGVLAMGTTDAYPQELVEIAVLLRYLTTKEKLLRQLREMNDHAEHTMRADAPFSEGFQERYAWVILELDKCNRLLQPLLLKLNNATAAASPSNPSTNQNSVGTTSSWPPSLFPIATGSTTVTTAGSRAASLSSPSTKLPPLTASHIAASSPLTYPHHHRGTTNSHLLSNGVSSSSRLEEEEEEEEEEAETQDRNEERQEDMMHDSQGDNSSSPTQLQAPPTITVTAASSRTTLAASPYSAPSSVASTTNACTSLSNSTSTFSSSPSPASPYSAVSSSSSSSISDIQTTSVSALPQQRPSASSSEEHPSSSSSSS
ncbi:Protein lin-9 [Balamuthia mandrillaris]